MYELALNAKVQEILYQELDNAILENDGKLTFDALISLPYLGMVVSETLRKYPSGIKLERRCTKDYILPGTNVTIKKCEVVVVPVMGIHHDEEYYLEPEKFDPERLSPENKAKRNAYTLCYLVRVRGAVSVEGKVAIAHLVHKYKLEFCFKTPSSMKFSTKLIMQPEGELWLNIKPRN